MTPSHPNRSVAMAVGFLTVLLPVWAASEADLHAHEAESRDLTAEVSVHVASAASTTTAVARSIAIYHLGK